MQNTPRTRVRDVFFACIQNKTVNLINLNFLQTLLQKMKNALTFPRYFLSYSPSKRHSAFGTHLLSSEELLRCQKQWLLSLFRLYIPYLQCMFFRI